MSDPLEASQPTSTGMSRSPFALIERLPLWLIVVLSGALYWVLALWFPLGIHVERLPTADIRSLAPTLLDGLGYALLLIALSVLQILAFRKVWGGSLTRVRLPGPDPARASLGPLALIGLVSALVALPLLLTYPVNANDIYRYVLRGRISAVHHGNPFIQPPSTYPGDPLLPYAGEWAEATTPYGPVWENVASVVSSVAGGSAFAGVLAFKVVGLLMLLLVAALLWFQMGHLPTRHRSAYTFLWALNPAVLLTFVVNGHNDALMLVWLLVGWLLARRGWPLPGLMAIVLAALTKPVAVLILPIYLIWVWRQPLDRAKRIRLIAGGMAGTLVLTWLAFLPWSADGGLLATPLALVTRLLDEGLAGAGFSVSAFVYFLAQSLGLDVSISTIGRIALILFGGFLLWLWWRTWNGRNSARGAADTFIGYILQALNYRIWYAVWPFPFLILDGAEREQLDSRTAYRLRAGVWFLMTSQLSVVIYGHVRVAFLGGNHIPAHLIGVPFTFILPLILARIPWRPVVRVGEAETAVRPGQVVE